MEPSAFRSRFFKQSQSFSLLFSRHLSFILDVSTHKRWVSVFAFASKNILSLIKRKMTGRLKETSYHYACRGKNLKRNSYCLFAFDFFDYGENI